MSKFVYLLREFRETLDYQSLKDEILAYADMRDAVEEYGRRLEAYGRRHTPVSRIDAHLYTHLVTEDERWTLMVTRKKLR